MVEAIDDPLVLERSIRAVTAIRQVVHAIWALSRAQLALVEHAASAASTYQAWIDAAVERVAGPPEAQEGTRRLTVIFGPERPYSSALIRRITEVVATLPEGDLGIVGARLAEAVQTIPEIDGRVRFRCSGSVAHDDLHEVALEVAAAIVEHGRGASVSVLHPAEPPVHFAHVPLIVARAIRERPPKTYSPLGEVAAAAVLEAIAGRLAVAAVESLRAEVRARIVAADMARRACDERRASLETIWQRERRETITRELLEIVAGREASWEAAKG